MLLVRSVVLCAMTWLPLVVVTFVDARFADAADRMNVLMIAIDDLRPALGCYGDSVAVTPNLDRLAASGVTFNRAYCQLAVCGPSRLSLLTGRRPDSIRVWDLSTHFRDTLPDLVTLPQRFKQSGYHTQSVGKVFHGSGPPSKDPPSWSTTARFDFVRDPALRYALPRNLVGKGLKRASVESADVDEGHYIDGVVCQNAIELLPELASNSEPFFLAVGFRKPHLPFCAPTKYWDLYDPMDIPLPQSKTHPVDAPELATRSWRELEGYTDIPESGELSNEKTRELRHGYYACVSYVDALVGRVLDALAENGLTEKTVVVLWGDHGFHLGEQGLWTKANNYEWSCRVPLIIADPRQTSAGRKCEALVELVDLYPTLVDLCSLEHPNDLEGISLLRLLSDPEQPGKQAVYSQYPRMRQGHRHRGHGDIMGYSVRTERFRYVEWRIWDSNEVVSRELYDHQVDPGETRNVANVPRRAADVAELSRLLAGIGRSAQPGISGE